jgi:hypothetical protein
MNMESYNNLIQCIYANNYTDNTAFCSLAKQKTKSICMKMFIKMHELKRRIYKYH